MEESGERGMKDDERKNWEDEQAGRMWLQGCTQKY